MWTPGSMATTSGSASTLCMGHSGRGCCQTTFSGSRRGKTALMAAWWLRVCWCGSLLVAERQERSWLVRFLLYHLTQWLGAAAGAGCARVLPVSLGGLWKNFLFCVACLVAVRSWKSVHFYFAFVSFSHCSGVWVLPVDYTVLDFSGRVRYLVRQWMHVLRGPWKNLHIFYDAVNSNPEAFHSRCFWLQVCLARLARWNLDIISSSSPFFGQFAAIFAAQCSIFRSPR